MNSLRQFSDEVLLAELIRRGKIVDAPTTRQFGDEIKEVMVGIGKDNYADISFPAEALKDLGLEGG